MAALRRSVEREGVIKFLTVRNWVLVLRTATARVLRTAITGGCGMRNAELDHGLRGLTRIANLGKMVHGRKRSEAVGRDRAVAFPINIWVATR